ncbi:hypothetical protein KC887_01185 [Candidatus Kaiserbacteria bacterium]|nr:hypothetical protein [Candidatus Kaiserbacteria bacterium]
MSKAKAATNGATELYEWQQEFAIKADLYERDVTALERAAASIPHIIISATNSYNEAYFCAAIEAGWIVSPQCQFEEVKRKDDNGRVTTERRYIYGDKEVGEMHPGAVRWLGQQVIGRYNEVTAVPLAL